MASEIMSKLKRQRVKVLKTNTGRSILIKDKTIELLSEMMEVTYNVAFNCYLKAEEIVSQCPSEDRLMHAKNYIILHKLRRLKKVS